MTKIQELAAERLSRPGAIALLRERLKTLCDEDHCACAAAARWNVFCGGFRALSDRELRDRFSWIARTRPRASREELERLASLYHLGRQEVTGLPLCCDVETREHCVCDGWNRFDNLALEGAVLELTGRSIQIS
ncbi:MAG: hypothetical protein WAU32_00335 [Thermoanaerobaculia bacterium]